ncbi:N-acetylglucosamine transport system permease protein [Actinokineospora alba]|uniref:N-acetylglucosamine transport system permease protein n=1 Tax=Actinokineospora alba TaxID=504798 RepID=A0A1H0IEP2_9PSEU|nr:carbohydrate ABC transporter permease [Actinokineospora alba]TDP70974.1 carbohydrate ABC transporter membrane protein 2 (CUT1 family) [Actinokineospora alba]SDI88767.1 N-acetylglucosamine transport system permease protein [Actinokineospora alba]SDO29862.1 N-acetylglucosamine transport system permease protein [Actinokineospora alba]
MTVTAPPVPRRTVPPRVAPRRPRPAPGSRGLSPLRLLGMAFVWLFTAFNILVLYWLLTATFKTPIEIFTKPFALPYQWFERGDPFRNIVYAWNNAGFGRAFLVTVVLVAVSSVAIVLVSAPAAYALTRLGVRGSNGLTNFIAIGMGIPFQTVVIPLFIGMAKLNLTNSLFGMFLVYVALSIPFTVFLLTGFFRSLPDELEEAASIDGASPLRTFFSIMLPLARGGLITALILNAIGLWNETLLALVFLNENANFTLARALFSFYGAASYQSEYGGLIAGVAIVVLPMLVLYVLLARRIITGLTLGAGK